MRWIQMKHSVRVCVSYPQGDLHLEGAARSRVLERESLVQGHVLSLQQFPQRQRQRPQRAFVLLVLHLKATQPVKTWLRGSTRACSSFERIDMSVPPPPAPGFWGCGLRRCELPPKPVHWSYIWSERVKTNQKSPKRLRS